jgi:hypothetical protein
MPATRTRRATNHARWAAKLEAKVARDRRNDELLAEPSWRGLRFWGHDQIAQVVATLREVLAGQMVTDSRPAHRPAGGTGTRVASTGCRDRPSRGSLDDLIIGCHR